MKIWFNYFIILVLFVSFASCDESKNSNDQNNSLNNTNNVNNSNNINNTNLWYEPDEQGRTTQGNFIEDSPEMVIITSDELEQVWEKYAAVKTAQGIFTKVVLMDEISQNYQGIDDAERLRNFLKEQHETANLRFVLMGGDKEIVPFRRVIYSIYVDQEYSTNAPTQTYFSNLSSDFDSDGDSVVGEQDEDLSLDELRIGDIAVGRVPAGNPEEVENYLKKYITYSNGTNGHLTYPLLISDIATSIPLYGDVDGAEGVEATFNEYFPESFKSNVRKLYATDGANSDYNGDTESEQSINEAFNDGFSIVYHNGHGSHEYLTSYIDKDFVNSMNNELPGVVISCSCLAGNYADVASDSTYDLWEEQTPENDSVGEKLINNAHGSVAYVGNASVGLGALGGSQFLHEIFNAIFSQNITYLGEAFNFGRSHMRDSDWTVSLIPINMTDDSEWWTQLGVILLGDPSLKIIVSDDQKLTLISPETYGPGFNEMSVTVKDSGGSPIEGVIVTIVKPGDFAIKKTTGNDGTALFSFLPYGPENIYISTQKEGFLPLNKVITPN